ncbi:MAG: DNA polymerase III [Treponema sp.]|nr:DNA polymerase III [Treponema sp.]
MFDNLLYQNASSLLAHDIQSGKLPGALLFAGPSSSGKLTCALEVARILSCGGEQTGAWMCACSSCRLSKELISQNMLLLGPRDCQSEISAAKKTFLTATYNNAPYLKAAQYLFIRSVRKLTLRFSPILWENDDKISKISPFLQAIDEKIDAILPEKELVENDALSEICEDVAAQCRKLASSFMYDSIPISQIRAVSEWARLTSASGKKIIIIENIEQMNESGRNALLKILEEPPSGVVFILTTTRRGSVMQTILSRVRTYTFSERSVAQQKEVLSRVFHVGDGHDTVESYLQTFLPVSCDEIHGVAKAYFDEIMAGKIPVAAKVVKSCADFESKFLFKTFLVGLQDALKNFSSPQTAEFARRNVESIRECYNNVTVYNQSTAAAIEKLTRDLTVNRNMIF